MAPRIGITCGIDYANQRIQVNADYVRAVQAARGIPVLLPPVPGDPAAILAGIDGLLLTGGVDVDPSLFGEEPLPKNGEIQPDRDASEIPLSRAALATGFPVLGICRGHQVLAVAAGGILYQDLPSQLPDCLKHSQLAPRWHPTHGLRIEPRSRLGAMFGPKLRVNTFHHQAVKAAPPGFVETAWAPDGVNEAIEHVSHPFALGVQWHPEAMWDRDLNYNALFRALVEASTARV